MSSPSEASLRHGAAVSRRAVVGGAASAAALALTVATADRSDAATRSISVRSYVSPNPYLHLLRRATYGPTRETLAELRSIGIPAWLDRQMRPESIDDRAFEAFAAQWGPQDTPIHVVRARQESGGSNGGEDLFEVPCAHVARAAWSKRQLLAVMEDFWSNHFNVTSPSDGIDATRAHYAATIRRHAFGSFADLLTAVTLHPAMLTYLDNRLSTDDAPNENHGRELLELHTLGAGNFTEADVLGSTRILTGLSVSGITDEFEFKWWDHWVGPVKVLGFTSPNATEQGGVEVAKAYLQYLAHHPATARRVVTKLCRHFVSDKPPRSLVTTLTHCYLQSGTSIASVLQRLFRSDEFRQSTGRKMRRPYESIVATVRTLGIGPDKNGYDGVKELVWKSRFSGNGPLEWHPPDGYPDVAAAWASAGGTLARWSSTVNLVAGWWPTTFTHPPLRGLLPRRLPATHGGLVEALTLRLFWMRPLPAHTRAVCRFLDAKPETPLRRTDPAVTWRLHQLVALLLDSPYHLYR